MKKKERVIYFDSSFILRNKIFSSNFYKLTRKYYNQHPDKVIKKITTFYEQINEESEQYYACLLNLLVSSSLTYIVTMDCFFRHNNCNIINIFGSTDIQNICFANVCLYNETIKTNIYKKVLNIILNADLVIIDDAFKNLQIGKHLIKKASFTENIFLSTCTPNKITSVNDIMIALTTILC